MHSHNSFSSIKGVPLLQQSEIWLEQETPKHGE